MYNKSHRNMLMYYPVLMIYVTIMYYFTSRVYKKQQLLIASNVSLVESESGVTLILLVGELVNSYMINKFF